MAWLPNRRLVLVWIKAGGLTTSLLGRIYSSDWQPVSEEFPVNSELLFDRIDAQAPALGGLRYYPYHPAVVAGPEGQFAVMWQFEKALSLRFFSDDGKALSHDILIDIPSSYQDATLVSRNGRLLLLYKSERQTHARLLDWQGKTQQHVTLPEFPITQVLTDLDGRFAIVSRLLTSPQKHRIQWFDQNLKALEEPVELAIDGRLVISQIPNASRWLLLWETKASQPEHPEPNSLSVQYYERNRVLGTPRHFSPTPDFGRNFLVGTKADSLGNIALIWEDGQTFFTQKGHVSVLRLNADLKPREEAFVLDNLPTGMHQHARIDPSSADELPIVWEHTNSDQATFALYGRTLDWRQARIEPLPQPSLPPVICDFSAYKDSAPYISVQLTSSYNRIQPGHVVVVLRKSDCLDQLVAQYSDIKARSQNGAAHYRYISFDMSLYPIEKARADLKRLAPDFGLERWNDDQIKTFAFYQDLIHRFGPWLQQIYLNQFPSLD